MSAGEIRRLQVRHELFSSYEIADMQFQLLVSNSIRSFQPTDRDTIGKIHNIAFNGLLHNWKLNDMFALETGHCAVFVPGGTP